MDEDRWWLRKEWREPQPALYQLSGTGVSRGRWRGARYRVVIRPATSGASRRGFLSFHDLLRPFLYTRECSGVIYLGLFSAMVPTQHHGNSTIGSAPPNHND